MVTQKNYGLKIMNVMVKNYECYGQLKNFRDFWRQQILALQGQHIDNEA